MRSDAVSVSVTVQAAEEWLIQVHQMAGDKRIVVVLRQSCWRRVWWSIDVDRCLTSICLTTPDVYGASLDIFKPKMTALIQIEEVNCDESHKW